MLKGAVQRLDELAHKQDTKVWGFLEVAQCFVKLRPWGRVCAIQDSCFHLCSQWNPFPKLSIVGLLPAKLRLNWQSLLKL